MKYPTEIDFYFTKLEKDAFKEILKIPNINLGILGDSDDVGVWYGIREGLINFF